MKKTLCLVLILSLGLFFQFGCCGVGVRTHPLPAGYRYSSSVSWSDSGMAMDSASLDLTPFIIGAVVVMAAAFAYVYLEVKQNRVRYALTPEGSSVQLLAHAEAPKDAVFWVTSTQRHSIVSNL